MRDTCRQHFRRLYDESEQSLCGSQMPVGSEADHCRDAVAQK